MYHGYQFCQLRINVYVKKMPKTSNFFVMECGCTTWSPVFLTYASTGPVKAGQGYLLLLYMVVCNTCTRTPRITCLHKMNSFRWHNSVRAVILRGGWTSPRARHGPYRVLKLSRETGSRPYNARQNPCESACIHTNPCSSAWAHRQFFNMSKNCL